MIEIEILDKKIRKIEHQNGWLWQYVIKYTKKGMKARRHIVVNAQRWDQSNKEDRASALRHMKRYWKFPQSEAVMNIVNDERIESEQYSGRNLWLITTIPGSWGVPFMLKSGDVKAVMRAKASIVLGEIRNGKRNWFTYRKTE